MDRSIIREAARIIWQCDHPACGDGQFLAAAICWAGDRVADFCLRRDDFNNKWCASGIYLVDAVWDFPDPEGDTPHEVMARLIIDFHQWESTFKSVKEPTQ